MLRKGIDRICNCEEKVPSPQWRWPSEGTRTFRLNEEIRKYTDNMVILVWYIINMKVEKAGIFIIFSRNSSIYWKKWIRKDRRWYRERVLSLNDPFVSISSSIASFLSSPASHFSFLSPFYQEEILFYCWNLNNSVLSSCTKVCINLLIFVF